VRISVRIEDDAAKQFEDLRSWWSRNRPAARSLKSQLVEASNRIKEAPYASPVYTVLNDIPIRRLLIRRTPYAIYYWVDEAKAEARVIAVWSCQRGEAPPLRVP